MSDDIDIIEADDETPVLIARREDWQKHGACNGTDPELWFPTRGAPAEQARAICAGCPVKAECLDYALRAGEKFGIWGGTSERERRSMRRTQAQTTPARGGRPRTAIRHGTYPRYRQHLRDGEDACDECKAANTAYVQAGKKARRAASDAA